MSGRRRQACDYDGRRSVRLGGSQDRASRPLPAKALTIRGVSAQPRLDTLDAESRRWVEQLSECGPRHDRAVERLHGTLLQVARHELGRRRGVLGMIDGPEFDDLVHQAAHDALLNILAKVGGFRGESRFITWAYKFVVFEVSAKAGRHAWQRQPPSDDEAAWARLSDSLESGPAAQVEQQEQLVVLVDAVASDLTARQREVFVAVALNEVPIDVLAIELDSNRNAIYKNLFDARRKLRARLAAAGYALPSPEAAR
jgi:RNA polymerase sigma-70 factor (ECF subfamily)